MKILNAISAMVVASVFSSAQADDGKSMHTSNHMQASCVKEGEGEEDSRIEDAALVMLDARVWQ